jgi:hypothetical protein
MFNLWYINSILEDEQYTDQQEAHKNDLKKSRELFDNK